MEVNAEAQPNSEFIPELSPPNPDSVKKYVLAQPNRDVAYRELVDCLLPEENRRYHEMNVNDPRNLDILSIGLQRKQNLEAILFKKKVPDNLTTIFNQLPPETMSQPGNDELMSFLSPLEQKVLSGASKKKPEDLDDFLVKKSLQAIAYNRSREKDQGAPKEVTTPKFYPELSPPNPESVKSYVLAQPERDTAYRELVSFLLPEENLMYHQMDVNDPRNLDLLSLALQRKQNLESILNKKKVSDNLTAIFVQLPAEILSQPNNDELTPFLSPLEQKVLSTASKNESEDVDYFLVKQSLLAIAYNRKVQKENESSK